jgi:hypothetical protein
MHGGKDRRDGTDIAGTKILIHHNTFMNPKVRAIGIRGKPEEEARVYNNWFGQEKPGAGVIIPWPAAGRGQRPDVRGRRSEVGGRRADKEG